MKFIDVHSHLNLSQFDADREEVIAKLKEEDIYTITVGVNLSTSREAVILAEKHENLFACVGLHPVDDPKENFNEKEFEILANHKRVVAIGECGLDYFRLEQDSVSEKQRQKDIFIKHIELSLKTGKPLMLHCRPSKGTMDAYNDTLDILESYAIDSHRLCGNAHFFVGDLSVTERFLKLGFTMSFSGVITFAHDYDGVIKMLPIESILSETDSPFASPVPYRGQRSNPLYVKEVVKQIAQIRNEDDEYVRLTTIDNAKRMFGFDV